VSRPELLDLAVVDDWLRAFPRWRRDDAHLLTTVRTSTYQAGAELLLALVPVADSLDHHPNASLGYRQISLELWTHDRGGLTVLDQRYVEGFEKVLDGRPDLLGD
jgi:4a-hydroxytetrahydrobiopterin dehydratase